jgi:phenylalanyl-tRNA synthetase beta chain
MAELALKRMLYLLIKNQSDIAIESRLTTSGMPALKAKEIIIPVSYFSNRMGVRLSKKEIKRHLKALEFLVREKRNKLHIEVPPFRSGEDIALPEDILEEVARMHGYDTIQPVLPATVMKVVSRDSQLELERAIRRYLVRSGQFQEVQTYNWYNHEFPGFLPENSKGLVRLINPVSATKPCLRDAILPNLLNLMQRNADHCRENNIFEIGSVFHNDGEFRVVSALSYSLKKKADSESFYLSLKGILDDMFDEFDLQQPDFVPYSELKLEESKDYPALAVCVAGKKAGQIGVLREDSCSEIVKGGQAVWFELELESLLALKPNRKRYTSIPKYPGSWFDFSVLIPDRTSFSNLEKRLDGYQNPLLKSRRYLYKYKGKGIQDEMTSYTYRFEVGADDRTLSNKDLEELHNNLKDFFHKEGIRVK